MKKENRSDIRIPLLSEKVIVDGLYYDVEDISTSGIFIRNLMTKKRGQIVTVEFTLPGDLGKYKVESTVIRFVWANSKKKGLKQGAGLRFNKQDDKIINSYIVYLRNKQIIMVSKRIVEEFYGPKEPIV